MSIGERILHRAKTEEDILQLVRGVMDRIDDVKLYYEIRNLNRKYYLKMGYHDRSTLKGIIALSILGLPITTFTLGSVVDRGLSSVLNTLHALGDKGLLEIETLGKKYYRWHTTPIFDEFAVNVLGEDLIEKIKNEILEMSIM